MKQNCSTGLFKPIVPSVVSKLRVSMHLIGRTSQSWFPEEMMLNANTSGIKDTNLISQRLSGKSVRMRNCSGSYLTRVLNNGKR